MACGVLYIIRLEFRYLKWARIAHLDIWNISYGQKKGRESNCQIDSRPEKIGNRPDLPGFRRRATYRWKLSTRTTTLLQTAFRSKVCSQVMGLQCPGRPRWWDFGTPTWESWEKKTIWMWALWTGLEYTVRGKVLASPKSGPWWVLCVRVARGLS